VSYQKIISGNDFNNDNSTVAIGGNVQTGFTAVGPLTIAVDNGGPGVPGPSTLDSVGASGLVVGANYAKQVAGEYVGKGYSSNLAGAVSTPLAIGGVAKSSGPQGIYGNEAVYTYDATDWSYVSGVVTGSGIHTAFGNDNAIRITRAAPGRFTYLETGATPTNDTYDAKTNG
jgi:hypothetical protein